MSEEHKGEAWPLAQVGPDDQTAAIATPGFALTGGLSETYAWYRAQLARGAAA